MRRERGSQIALDHLRNVFRVLQGQRPVEPELVQQPLAPRGVHAALTGKVLDRISRNEVDERERQQRHADERRYDQRCPAEDEGEHEAGKKLATVGAPCAVLYK